MSYLDRFDSHYRKCCGVLSVEEQVRSGFKTKGEVNRSAQILFREFGKKTKSKRTRNKKTGELECCCCSVEAIEKNLVPPPLKETVYKDYDIKGRRIDPISGGELIPAPRREALFFSDAPSTVGDTFDFFTEDSTILGEYGFETESDISGITEERAEVERTGMDENELLALYDMGSIDLRQLTQGIQMIREGLPLREVLELGRPREGGSESTRRGGRREGAGRPSREQARIAEEEGMRPSEVRAVDITVDRMLQDLEEEINIEEEEEEV
jgi:hypothetical protein